MIINNIAPLTCGFLVLKNSKEIIEANEQGLRFVSQMHRANSNTNLIPREIQYLCESFTQCRILFPDQFWLIESRVFIDQVTAFHLQVQPITAERKQQPLLLVKIEDEYKLMKTLFSDEAHKYQFTAREREIWMLYKTNHTYKDIATKLGITSNTVKKHMKSIFIKLKANENT